MEDANHKKDLPKDRSASIRFSFKDDQVRAVVVAQLVEQSLLIPEVCGSNQVTGKISIEHLFTCFISAVLKR